jgi:6-phospho-beta-glucosidase
VVEVPTVIDANGVHPLTVDPPGLAELGLMQQVKAVEQLIISAVTNHSRQEAVTAFALHPLVDSLSTARKLVDGYIAQIPEVAEALDG